ncbi:MAG: hypothetical protein AAGA96_13435, partial [Verrucomicrobiota bacterium]
FAWLANLLFVGFMLPARILSGWSWSRAERRPGNRNWIMTWLPALWVLPVVTAYVVFVWFTQYLSWHGTYSLLEQHAFLIPVPLMKM